MFSPAIQSLDLSPVSFKVALETRWTLDEIDRVEMLYRCFLEAKRRNWKRRIAPSRTIDTYWHHHILDTMKYMKDCELIFGRYLHHFPYSGLRGQQDSEKQARLFKSSTALVERILQEVSRASQ